MTEVSFELDTERMERAAEEYVRIVGEKAPKSLNRHLWFIAERARKLTPAVNPGMIWLELLRVYTPKKGKPAPAAWMLGAKRARKAWGERNAARVGKKSRGDRRAQWRKLVEKKTWAMVGARKAATGFLRVGWLSAQMDMDAAAGRRTFGGSEKLRGRFKGEAHPVVKGEDMIGAVVNFARTKGELKSGGSALQKYATAARDQAVMEEVADMENWVEAEILKEQTAKFNAGS